MSKYIRRLSLEFGPASCQIFSAVSLQSRASSVRQGARLMVISG